MKVWLKLVEDVSSVVPSPNFQWRLVMAPEERSVKLTGNGGVPAVLVGENLATSAGSAVP